MNIMVMERLRDYFRKARVRIFGTEGADTRPPRGNRPLAGEALL